MKIYFESGPEVLFTSAFMDLLHNFSSYYHNIVSGHSPLHESILCKRHEVIQYELHPPHENSGDELVCHSAETDGPNCEKFVGAFPFERSKSGLRPSRGNPYQVKILSSQ